MSVDFFTTDVFSCTATFVPWAAEMAAKSMLLLLLTVAVAVIVRRRHPALLQPATMLGLLALVLLPLMSMSITWNPGFWILEPLAGSLRPAARVGAGHGSWLLVPWGAGAVLILVRLLFDMTVLAWHTRASSPEPGWTGQARMLARRLGIRRPIQVLSSEDCEIPYTWGSWRGSVIVLPSQAADWEPERRDAVLLHELGHIRRRDGASLLAARMVCALYWFNPLVWWLERLLREEAERACDQLVVQEGMAPATYARHLLDIVRHARLSRRSALPAPAMADSSLLGRRIAALMENQPPTRVGRLAALALMLVLVVPTLALGALPWPGTRVHPPGTDIAVCDEEQPVKLEPQNYTPIDAF